METDDDDDDCFRGTSRMSLFLLQFVCSTVNFV